MRKNWRNLCLTQHQTNTKPTAGDIIRKNTPSHSPHHEGTYTHSADEPKRDGAAKDPRNADTCRRRAEKHRKNAARPILPAPRQLHRSCVGQLLDQSGARRIITVLVYRYCTECHRYSIGNGHNLVTRAFCLEHPNLSPTRDPLRDHTGYVLYLFTGSGSLPPHAHARFREHGAEPSCSRVVHCRIAAKPPTSGSADSCAGGSLGRRWICRGTQGLRRCAL